MEIKMTLPLKFSELLNTYLNNSIGVCCLEGHIFYYGKLVKVRKNSIVLFEKGINYSIDIEKIYCFTPAPAYAIHTKTHFEQSKTTLYFDLQRYLGKTVMIRQKGEITCSTEGEIKFIGKDYIVMLNYYDNALTYIHADENLQFFTFG